MPNKRGGTFINFSIFFQPLPWSLLGLPVYQFSRNAEVQFFSVVKWDFSFNLELRDFFLVCIFFIFENFFDYLLSFT